VAELDEAAPALRSVIAGYEDAMAILRRAEWRQGRTNPCNLYARTGGADWKQDFPIGSMSAPALAAEAVRAHNLSLRSGGAGG